MIKSLWVLISTLCVANMLALALFMGWLGASDRLSVERLDRARLVFVQSLAEAEAEAQLDETEAGRAAAAEAAAAKIGTSPITAEQRMRIIQEYAAQIEERTARTRRETQDMIDTLMQQQSRFLEERQAFERQKAIYEAMREEIAELEGSEQFAKSLAIYQKVKADVAADMMSELIQAGGIEQVVTYLDAMNARVASKIIDEFESRSPALAADLLERLRTHGLVARASEDGP